MKGIHNMITVMINILKLSCTFITVPNLLSNQYDVY